MRLITGYFNYLTKHIHDQRETCLINYINSISPHPKNLLDLGCDDGLLTRQIGLATHISDLYGVDISSTRIKLAQKNHLNAKANDLNKSIPFASSKFDIILSVQVIEHLLNIDTFLAEIKRVLAPKGHLLITTENLASWHNIVALTLGLQPYTGPYISRQFSVGHHPLAPNPLPKYEKNMPMHTNVMTTRTLIQLLSLHGFSITTVTGLGYYPFFPPLSTLISQVDPYHAAVCLITSKH